jgi:hypothetical protein
MALAEHIFNQLLANEIVMRAGLLSPNPARRPRTLSAIKDQQRIAHLAARVFYNNGVIGGTRDSLALFLALLSSDVPIRQIMRNTALVLTGGNVGFGNSPVDVRGAEVRLARLFFANTLLTGAADLRGNA